MSQCMNRILIVFVVLLLFALPYNSIAQFSNSTALNNINATNKLNQSFPDSSLISGTWTAANSPYTIEGEAIIPVDSTLVIEPGVEVRFKTGSDFDYSDGIVDVGYFRVNGKLVAAGTAAEPITFTREGESGNWGVIYFTDWSDDGSVLEYCRIEYGNRISRIWKRIFSLRAVIE